MGGPLNPKKMTDLFQAAAPYPEITTDLRLDVKQHKTGHGYVVYTVTAPGGCRLAVGCSAATARHAAGLWTKDNPCEAS